MNRKKLFTKKFSLDFDATYDFIYSDSPQNARKFAKELDLTIEKIKEQATAYPPEPALPTKRNWYRSAFCMESWKIVYKQNNNLLIFLGIIHVKRHSREMKKLRTNKYK